MCYPEDVNQRQNNSNSVTFSSLSDDLCTFCFIFMLNYWLLFEFESSLGDIHSPRVLSVRVWMRFSNGYERDAAGTRR